MARLASFLLLVAAQAAPEASPEVPVPALRGASLNSTIASGACSGAGCGPKKLALDCGPDCKGACVCEDAAKYSKLSAATYCSKDDSGLVDAHKVDKWPNFAEVGRFKGSDTCIVVVRGTDSLAEAWQDFTSMVMITWRKGTCNGCKVGHGLNKAYRNLVDDVTANLQKMKCSKVSITGHSLGAAVALMLMAYYSKDYDLQTSYTFGAPGIGNQAFNDFFVEQTKGVSVFNIAHGTDPIPGTKPPRGVFAPGTTILIPSPASPPKKFYDHECYVGWLMGCDVQEGSKKTTYCNIPCNQDTDAAILPKSLSDKVCTNVPK